MSKIRTDRQNETTQWISNWLIFPLAVVFSFVLVFILYSIIPAFLDDFFGFFTFYFYLVIWLFLIAGLTGYFTDKLHLSENKEKIIERNEKALKLIEEIENNQSEKVFFVYLRSFKFENLSHNWYWEPIKYTSDIFKETTIDEELEYAFSLGNIDLVCLGDTDKLKVGAARIRTDNLNWRNKIDLLLENSMGIIVVPGPTSSVIEEIIKIYSDEDLLKKTVFVMLPKTTGSWYGANWDVILVDKLKKSGIEFPLHKEEGLIFNSNGKSISLTGFHLKSPIDLLTNIIGIKENK